MRRLTRLLLAVLASVIATVHAVPADLVPPTVVTVNPAPNAVVLALRQIEVFFSEPVAGVEATDLRINSVPATNVFASAPGQYVFEFTQPAAGTVTATWAGNHGITDLAAPPNAFAGGSWSLALDTNPPLTGVILNELMAANSTGLRDEDGDASDWIELRNLNSVPVDLAGWFLTDEAGNLAKWRFPSVALEPNGFLVVFASGKNRGTNLNRLHTNFQLASGGEFLALINAITNVVSSFAPAFPSQPPDVSYGRDRLSPELTGTMTTPTPGQPNSTAGPGFAPDVQFSVEGGTFIEPFALRLSTTDPAAEIRYTVHTGGAAGVTNVPGQQSLLYTGAIPVSVSTQIRARAFRAGYLPGAPRTETFIQLQPTAANFSSDLPIVVIHNLGQGAVPTTGDQPAYIAVFDRDEATGRASLTNRPSVNGRIGFNVRGRGSQGYAKSGFAVEFWDEYGLDKDMEVLGMPAESDWTLYATLNTDAALIHNPLAREMSNILGRKASRTRFVEVFLNTAGGPVRYVNPTNGNYNGIYVLIEKIKQGKDRVDVASLQVEDTSPNVISGGYIFKSDDPPEADEVVFTGARQQVIMVYPGKRALALPQRVAQFDYVRNYFAGFSNALFGVNFTNPISGYAHYIDADSWIDHAMVSVTTFNVDAIRLSGYFYKDRGKPMEMGPVWDADRTFGAPDDRQINPRVWRNPVSDGGTDVFNAPGPGPAHHWFPQLFRDINFWQRYIDRYQTFRQGPYSLANLYAIIDQMLGEVSEAQPREQARWGSIAPYRGTNGTGPGTFATEVTWLKTWLANRLNFMDTNFLDMPIIGRPGGLVTPGTQVNVVPAAKAGSSVIYTLDGTDPRLPDGIISPAAFSNSGPVTITIEGNVRIVARSYNPSHRNLTGPNAPPLNSVWSGPVAATYWVSTPPLRITEIMYHPAHAPAGNTNDVDNFEYLEVKNIGGTPLNVNRFRVRGGLDFDFPNESLAAGEQAVIVKSLASFRERYGAGPRVLGVYTNDNLANDGDHLVLEGGVREPILDFDYRDDWYPATDGHGYSLQIVNDGATTTAWGLKASWRPSGVAGGTPSAADPGAAQIATIYVNEALTHTDPVPADAIELYNPTGNAVNLGGWYLTDDLGTPKKYRIPDGTSIPANGYRVFYESNSFGTGVNGFALSSHGDEVYLFSADAGGNLTGWAHGYSFGPQAGGVTFGRHLTSLDEDRFVAQATQTLGTANSGLKVGPIIISEINYHPPDFPRPQGLVDNSRDEYIELQNISGSSVPLYDPLNPANTWRLRDAVDFTFPAGVVLPPGGYALLVSFNPADSGALAAFRSNNGVAAGTPIYGPWNGQLDNSSDSIELVRPDLPDPAGTPTAGFAAYILVDKVAYRDTLPWPTGLPDGLGAALGRANLASYGNDPANWRSAPKTPGASLPTGDIPATIVVQPVSTTGIQGQSASFSLTATGSALGYIWTFNGKPLSGASLPVLTLNNLNPNQAGTYSCYVFNTAGSVQSSEVTLTVRKIPTIIEQPLSRAVYIKPDPKAANLPNGTNVTFSVTSISSEPPVSYQWRINGADIPGAVGSSHTVLDVQLDEEGDYTCAITDGTGTIYSAPARLAPWLQPVIIQKPTDITVAAGSDFTASVEITGNPAPFAYSWRRNLGSVVVNTNSGNYKTNFITLNTATALLGLTNNIQSSNFTMRLVVYNDANTAPGATTTFNVTVMEDTDRDGVPNSIELGLGLDPNSAADAAGDLDNDGMSNRAEFIAGTDPTNSLSFLKIEQSVTPGDATLQFGSISNHTYTIQYTDNFNLSAWNKLTDLPALRTNYIYEIADPGWTTNRFYRVATPRQP